MKTFGEKIKELRKNHNLSQPALAKKLGVSNGMISNWENNINEPGLTHIKNIATFFGVSADYIVGTNKLIFLKNFYKKNLHVCK